jgi:phenylalanyl-tRNA synthetase beta chain
MRPSILPGLLDAVRHNLNQQRRDLKIFEIGKVFAAALSEDNLPTEQEALTLVVTGNELSEDRMMPNRELDFYDAKGAVEAALEAVGIEDVSYSSAEIKHLRRGQTAKITIDRHTVGYIGRLNDQIASGYKFRQPVYVAELNLEAILAMSTTPVNYRPLPKFPGVIRDISFVAKREVTYESIRETIVSLNADLCRSIEFVDIYEGKGLGEDERSITIRLEYRSDERTLVEDEVDQIHRRIVDSAVENLNVRLRA